MNIEINIEQRLIKYMQPRMCDCMNYYWIGINRDFWYNISDIIDIFVIAVTTK